MHTLQIIEWAQANPTPTLCAAAAAISLVLLLKTAFRPSKSYALGRRS